MLNKTRKKQIKAMKLSDKAIKEFQEIYQNRFGEIITEDEANVIGLKLLKLFSIVYKPIAKTEKDWDEKLFQNAE